MPIHARVCLLCGVFALWLSAHEGRADQGPRPGAIAGTIISELTRQPVAEATVAVEGAELQARSDERGAFRVAGVPVGSYRLLVTHPGFLAARLADVVVSAQRDTPVSVRLQESLRRTEEVVVNASYFDKPPELTTGSFAMGYEEVRRAPGALGDVSRMLQVLPGAATRNDQRNDIVARGGSPSENLILVDNIEVPNLSHFGGQGASGGPITMLNAELVSDVAFLAGGFPAQYGNRLSSVLDVSLREGSRRRFETEFDLSMAGAGLVAEGPLGKRGSWIVSARRSFIDLIAGAYGLTSVPQYANYQAKAVYDLNPRNRVSFVSLGGWDDILFEVDMDDLEDPGTFEVDDVGWRVVSGLNLQTFLGTRGVGTLTLSHAENDFRVDVRDALLEGALVERNRSRERETTAKYDVTLRLDGKGALRVGTFAKRTGAVYDYQSPLGSENFFSTDPTRINVLALDESFGSWNTGGYVQLSPRVTRHLTLAAGGRLDHYGLSGKSTVAPRGGLTLHLRRNLDLSATFGRYYQLPPLVVLKALPENAGLGPIRSDHYVAGAAYYPAADTKVTVEAYRKRYFSYPVSTQFPMLTLADAGEQYGVENMLMPLAGEGRGRTTGIELFAQKKLARGLWGQVSYAYSRCEQRALDGVWRRGTFDLPHVFSLVAGLRASKSLELSTKFSYTSGRPTTPIAPEAREQNRLIYDATRYNAERGRAYHRLDFRVDRRASHRWGNLVFYLEVDNVYNRENVRFYYWNPKKREVHAEPQTAFMAIGGVNVEF